MDIIEKDITKLATIRTPAFAKYYAEINDLEELKEANLFVMQHNLKLQILGNGTNVLFTKDRYDDVLFIKLGKSFSFFKVFEDSVEIGASFSFVRAGKKLINLGYGDFIYMTLIPGSLGGGVRQNAGTTKEGEIKDNFISAKIYDLKEDKIVIIEKDQMNFRYRNSIIQSEANSYIVLSSKFTLGKTIYDIDNLNKIVQEKNKLKKKKEPSGYTFGSTFKNLDIPAWKYLSKLNLCEESIGGAKFSNMHCNWIINYDNASGIDVLNLIEMAKGKVLKDFNILLHEEVEKI